MVRAARLDDPDLVLEDVMIHTVDFLRWVNPNYEMRLEEVEIFLVILNLVSEAMGIDMLFVDDSRLIPEVLERLNWSVEGDDSWVS